MYTWGDYANPALDEAIETSARAEGDRLTVLQKVMAAVMHELVVLPRYVDEDVYYQGERNHTGQLAGMGLGLPMVASTLWGVGGACHLRNRADGPGFVVELVFPVGGP